MGFTVSLSPLSVLPLLFFESFLHATKRIIKRHVKKLSIRFIFISLFYCYFKLSEHLEKSSAWVCYFHRCFHFK
ncbi:MAG: hypothetical protein TRG1_3286 [Flavobacteriaceae bacterium FS1-H7996/R]|nr:MAG: hypothetical protein TRG1_3286 [Flavobacteriaceae bacterium FS1-H7996/R]